MPFTKQQIAKFEAIRRKNNNLDQWHEDRKKTFKERHEQYKEQMEHSNVILSYPHWVMSERLRVQDPELYEKWYNEMQETGIETPVPKSIKAQAEQHVAATLHVLKRAAEHNVDLDASPPKKPSFMIDDIIQENSTTPPPQASGSKRKLEPEEHTPIKRSYEEDLEDILSELRAPEVPEEVLTQVAEKTEDEVFISDIIHKINSTDNLWTFIYRGPPPTIVTNSRISAIIIQHSDHYHVVFQALPQNRNRSLQRLLQVMGIPSTYTFDILSTLQPVVDWFRFAPYLARTGYSVQTLGTKLQHLAEHIGLTPADQKDCATLNRESRKQQHSNVNRTKRTNLIDELIEVHRCTHLKELKRCLTRKQRLTIYNEFGKQWEESAIMCIEAFNEELFERQTHVSFEEYMLENNHMSVCAHPKTLDDPFLDNLLAANKIDKDKFCKAIHEIMNKKIDRLNCLCIEGPTTTGKSLVLKMICQNYHCGTVQRSGDHSQFFLQNLVDKSIALMEEPRITIATVNDFKELLGALEHTSPLSTQQLYMNDAIRSTSEFASDLQNCRNHGALSVLVTSRLGMASGGKRILVDSTNEDDGTGETGPATAKRIRLLRPRYNTTTITITRKQHITVNQYKPADTSDTFAITCLPLSTFEFWALQSDQQFAEPFDTLRTAFPLCSFNHATLRLSHYIPLQKSLQGSNAVDVTSFNSSPYMYIAEDDTGLLNTVPTPVTEQALLDQNCKVPSNTYWQFSSDQGLLACNNVHTLSANEVFFKRYDFDNNGKFLVATPAPTPRGFAYMPGDYFQNVAPYNYSPFWKKLYSSYAVPTTPITVVPDQIAFNPYAHTMQPIFLFPPYIEPVSASEDIVRMMGHVLLETQLTLTLIAPPDGWRNIASNLTTWTNANSCKLDTGTYTDTTLHFPTFFHHA
ncbi:unnamed protein product [Dicrocoelium dendriticum]|nr:unnamed protein product [Dicrocoelium dendriticum]